MTHSDDSVDADARDVLAARGLELRLVRPDDRAAVDAWGETVARGFHEAERSAAAQQAAFELQRERRRLGVYDPTGPAPELPVGTFADWRSELTVPGGRIPALAITSVTVAPTHRRRGITRTLMEGELRAALGAGIPAAMLTVSESTLYGRYGFGAAADAASWRIDAKRASWHGPVPTGRVDVVSRVEARRLAAELHERGRASTPGEAQAPGGHWDDVLGTRADVDEARKIRAVRYAREDGVVEGLVAYTVADDPTDFTRATVTVRHLLAVSRAAYAALWRFILELDLVAEVRASELSVDEPVRWMLSDPRAASVTVTDHHYVRILDVAAVLSARRYSRPGTLLLDVEDPLGMSGGRFLLEIDEAGEGCVTVSPRDVPPRAVHVSLGIVELAMLSLGGVSAASLAAAGRIDTDDEAGASVLLGWHTAPRLTFWY